MDGHGTININTHVETLAEPYQFGADTIKPGEFVVIDVIDTAVAYRPKTSTGYLTPSSPPSKTSSAREQVWGWQWYMALCARPKVLSK